MFSFLRKGQTYFKVYMTFYTLLQCLRILVASYPCHSDDCAVSSSLWLNLHFPLVIRVPWWVSGKESACSAGDLGSIPGSRRSPGGRRGDPTPVLLPGESHGQRSLAGYSPWGYTELDTTEATKQQQQQWLMMLTTFSMCLLVIRLSVFVKYSVKYFPITTFLQGRGWGFGFLYCSRILLHIPNISLLSVTCSVKIFFYSDLSIHFKIASFGDQKI